MFSICYLGEAMAQAVDLNKAICCLSTLIALNLQLIKLTFRPKEV